MRRILFFLRRAFIDVVNPFRFGVSVGFGDDVRFPYGLRYSSDGMHKYYNLKEDSNGIIMMSHYVDHDSEETNYYSPVKIAHYALGAYNDYIATKDDVYVERFNKHIDFLVNSRHELVIDGVNCVIWTTPSTNPKYGIGMHYKSAIVQGLVISALCRASVLNGNPLYRDLVLGALQIFRIPVEKGGVLSKSKWGDFYEEYPCVPYSHVVNGFVFSLIGLYDSWQILKIGLSKELFDAGLKTLRIVFPVWYTYRWSRYDLRDLVNGEPVNYATHHYQCLHADLLAVLYIQTNDDVVLKYQLITEKQLKQKWYLLFVYLNKFRTLIVKR